MPNKKISEFSWDTDPNGSDFFPIVHNGVTMRIALSAITGTTSVSTGSTSTAITIDKIYFYEINYNRDNHSIPIANPIMTENAKATAPFLYQGFGQSHNVLTSTTVFNFYSELLFEIKEVGGIQIDGLQFSSLTDLNTYLSLNLSATTDNTVANSFTVRMYGNKKIEYQKINKIRGINTFFSSLRGRGSYWRSKVRPALGQQHKSLNNLFVASQSPQYIEPAMLQLFTKRLFDYFISVDTSGLNYDEVRKSIWFNEKPKQFYNLHPISEITTPTGSVSYGSASNGRLMYNPMSGTFVGNDTPNTMVKSSIFLLNKSGDTFYFTDGPQYNNGINDGLTGLPTSNFGGGVDIDVPVISNTGTFRNAGFETILVNAISAIRVYQLQSPSGNVSFLIKPMGIDTILIDYIEDNTNASLYGLFNSQANGKQIVIKFNNSTKVNGKVSNVGWRVQLDDYELFTLDKVSPLSNFETQRYRDEMTRYSKNSFKNIRFFYGYPDGTISPLSDDEIYNVVNSNGCALKRLVRKNPIN